MLSLLRCVQSPKDQTPPDAATGEGRGAVPHGLKQSTTRRATLYRDLVPLLCS